MRYEKRLLTGSHGPKQYFTLHWKMTPYDSVNLKASYTDWRAVPSGEKAGKMVASTGHPSSSIIWKVLLESLAIATQLLAKIPYGARMKEVWCYLGLEFFYRIKKWSFCRFRYWISNWYFKSSIGDSIWSYFDQLWSIRSFKF